MKYNEVPVFKNGMPGWLYNMNEKERQKLNFELVDSGYIAYSKSSRLPISYIFEIIYYKIKTHLNNCKPFIYELIYVLVLFMIAIGFLILDNSWNGHYYE